MQQPLALHQSKKMHIESVEIVNFRKLKSVRIGISKETTVFVGANNSGKTSAMLALRSFLVEKERKSFGLNDFTLSNWIAIDRMGKSWETAQHTDKELPESNWTSILPFLDIWLHAEKSESYLVQKIIPTLDWNGGALGVRLRLEPKDTVQLQKDYLIARDEARRIEAADLDSTSEDNSNAPKSVVLWPRSLTEFIQRRFSGLFTIKSYILDPEKLTAPEHGEARPQEIPSNAHPIDGDPLKGLIRIDEISAQRGFGQSDATPDSDESTITGSTATRRMSDQLRRYWSKHLDPFANPDPKDITALKAIEQAQRAFDERLRDGFATAIREVEKMGYPGVTDPKLKISSRLKPIDGLNHDTAVQYVIPVVDGEGFSELHLPEASNGLGYQNLISMIFRLMSYRDAWMRIGKAALNSKDDADVVIPPLHLVLVEEPEAHLHTQVQQVFVRQAYKILRNNSSLAEHTRFKTQLIVSTHSSHIAHECDFDNLRYFRRIPVIKQGIPLSRVINLGSVFGEDEDTKRFVTRYIKVTHCDLFFADAAVFLEGPAERILVPFFLRHQKALSSLHESYITWLEIAGSHAHRLKPLVEHLGLTTLIITDIDAKDKDGKKACPQRNAGLTSRNYTLKSWCPGNDDFDTLLDASPKDKTKFYPEQNFSIRVAYQSPIKISYKGNKEEEALCNTFEDALVIENTKLLSEGEGTGLWSKFKSAINSSNSLKQLSDNLFSIIDSDGKAEFALSLLELEEPNELHPPHYIIDGLKWLSAQVKQRQIGLEAIAQEDGKITTGK